MKNREGIKNMMSGSDKCYKKHKGEREKGVSDCSFILGSSGKAGLRT